MKTKNKLITVVLLSAGAAAGTALINEYIKMSAVSKNLLENQKARCYKWRLGNIYYTKTGSGKPLLLIHDLDYASSSCEWDAVLNILKDHYTVYSIDLLGCGRSEKPNLTYTNFLYVQLLNDFVKSEIGRRTNIIATGASSALAVMACGYNPDLFEQIMLINPEDFTTCSQIPGKYAKLYKFILDFPIIGTLMYHIASNKKIIIETFKDSYYHNAHSIKSQQIDEYYEAAHLGESPKSIYSSVKCNYTKCSISRTLEKINHSIYIIGGADEPSIKETIDEYTHCNPAVESSIIPSTKHLPQIENPKEVCDLINIFFQ